jgi:hypothetical protein
MTDLTVFPTRRGVGSWHVAVTLLVTLLLGLPLRGAIGMAVNHGHVSDPGFVSGLGWTLAAAVVVAAVGVNAWLQWIVTGWHTGLWLLAAVAVAVLSLFLTVL